LIIISLIITAIFSQNLIEVYPNNGNQSYTLNLNDNQVDELMLRTDIKFADITRRVVIPQDQTLVFPDKPTQQGVIKPINEKITTESIKAYLEKLCSHPHRMSRRQGSELSIEWIVSTVNAIVSGLPSERKGKFKVEKVPVPGYVANSVIVTFEGSNKDDHVIFGAHADDVGHPNAGADDNGSGTVSVLEAFKVIATSTYNPKRSILFMFYSAEESGLIGSRLIATRFKNQGKKVYAVLNHDMVGYNRPNSPLEMYLILPSTNSQLNAFVSKLVKEYSGIPLKDYNRSYGSDHISWHNQGYPASGIKEFYFSPQYHQSTDKPGVINYNLIKEFTKAGVAFVIETSSA